MNKTEFIAAVAEAAGVSKADAKKVIDASIDTVIAKLVAGEDVSFSGFAAFQVKNVEERTAHNPSTGETITVPAHKAPVCKISSAVKKIVNE